MMNWFVVEGLLLELTCVPAVRQCVSHGIQSVAVLAYYAGLTQTNTCTQQWTDVDTSTLCLSDDVAAADLHSKPSDSHCVSTYGCYRLHSLLPFTFTQPMEGRRLSQP